MSFARGSAPRYPQVKQKNKENILPAIRSPHARSLARFWPSLIVWPIHPSHVQGPFVSSFLAPRFPDGARYVPRVGSWRNGRLNHYRWSVLPVAMASRRTGPRQGLTFQIWKQSHDPCRTMWGTTCGGALMDGVRAQPPDWGEERKACSPAQINGWERWRVQSHTHTHPTRKVDQIWRQISVYVLACVGFVHPPSLSPSTMTAQPSHSPASSPAG